MFFPSPTEHSGNWRTDARVCRPAVEEMVQVESRHRTYSWRFVLVSQSIVYFDMMIAAR